ncbi:MAG: hypothetical protein ACE5MH_01270 [Terriglobia bacterium]
MVPELIPEDSSQRTESIGGYPIAITSYRLGSTYYAKAEIHLPGAGARIAAAEDTTREAAEGKVLAKVRRLLEKKS